MGIVALVLAIVGVVFELALGSYSVAFPIIGFILCIVGIVLGAVARKNPEKRGIATAGMIISIVGAAIGVIVIIAAIACVSAIGSLASYY